MVKMGWWGVWRRCSPPLGLLGEDRAQESGVIGRDGVAALLAAGFRSNDDGRERGLPRAAPIICDGKRRRGGEGV
jgi:hypothetical protein